jgi:hypothetical protein
MSVALDGVVISVLVTGPKVRGFKLGRGRWSFMGNKNPHHASFGGEVKPEAPCRKIFPHLRYFEVWTKDTS